MDDIPLDKNMYLELTKKEQIQHLMDELKKAFFSNKYFIIIAYSEKENPEKFKSNVAGSNMNDRELAKILLNALNRINKLGFETN